MSSEPFSSVRLFQIQKLAEKLREAADAEGDNKENILSAIKICDECKESGRPYRELTEKLSPLYNEADICLWDYETIAKTAFRSPLTVIRAIELCRFEKIRCLLAGGSGEAVRKASSAIKEQYYDFTFETHRYNRPDRIQQIRSFVSPDMIALVSDGDKVAGFYCSFDYDGDVYELINEKDGSFSLKYAFPYAEPGNRFRDTLKDYYTQNR